MLTKTTFWIQHGLPRVSQIDKQSGIPRERQNAVGLTILARPRADPADCVDSSGIQISNCEDNANGIGDYDTLIRKLPNATDVTEWCLAGGVE
jgi:hypothetical protein